MFGRVPFLMDCRCPAPSSGPDRRGGGACEGFSPGSGLPVAPRAPAARSPQPRRGITSPLLTESRRPGRESSARTRTLQSKLHHRLDTENPDEQGFPEERLKGLDPRPSAWQPQNDPPKFHASSGRNCYLQAQKMRLFAERLVPAVVPAENETRSRR